MSRKSSSHESGEGSETAVLFTTTRHRCKLQEGGYFYVFDKMSTNGLKKFWRCEKKSTCNARLHTDAITNEVLKRATPHNHPAHVVASDAQQSSLKRQADETPIDDDLPIKQANLSPFQALLQQCPALTEPQRVEETLENFKREYNGAILENYGQLMFPGAAADYLRFIFPETSSGISENPLFPNQTEGSNCLTAEANESNAERGPTRLFESGFMDSEERGQRAGELEKFLRGGLIIWSSDITQIIDEGERFCRLVSSRDSSTCASLLITGGKNSGKSCLAALIAKNSDFPCIKISLPHDMLGLDEATKVAKLIELFEECGQLPSCLLFLDGLEMLIEYCKLGDLYSNAILQTLLLLLRREAQGPMQRSLQDNHHLLVLATVTSDCAMKLDLHDYFTCTIEVPMLTDIRHLMAVIEDSNIFSMSECRLFAVCLARESNRYSIGIKRLLTLIELMKCYKRPDRFRTLFSKLLNWKQ